MNNTTLEKSSPAISNFSQPATDETIQRTIAALAKNGIQAFVFDSDKDLKKKLYELIPEKSEVMTMTSVTLDTLGIPEEISTSGKYQAVRTKLKSAAKNDQRKISTTADYSLGSVHAVTENGEVLIASATGSQLAAYAFGTEKAIWIVGTQKLVKNREEGIKRIYEYCFPLEDERAKKVYNAGSKVGKILTINSEVPGRLTLLFLKQNIGF